MRWKKSSKYRIEICQCRFNIRLNAKFIIETAQRHGDLDKARRDLGTDMVLGISNGLSAEDVINESEKAISDLEVNTEARQALEELYKEVRELKSKWNYRV